MTRIHWLILIDLVLAVICIYGVLAPLVVLGLNAPPAVVDVPEEPTAEPAIALAVPEATIITPTRAPTHTPTRRPIAIPPTATRVLAPTVTRTPIPAPTPTAIPQPAVERFSLESFAGLATNPRARLVSQSNFFTSACYGENVNPLQDRDYMTPSDWGGGSDTKCLFGFALDPNSRLPTGRYSAGGGPDNQPRFFLIPGGAIKDQRSIKALSSFHVIVDPAIGCDALGTLGITADGVSYQCSACAFLRDGNVCPNVDGSRSIVLPTSRSIRLNAEETGGTYGFLGFPAVIFRRDFSFFVTGRAGYPPPRMYFESQVDTFLPNVTPKTTAEMTRQEAQSIAAEFDRLLAGKLPMNQIASFERLAQPSTPAQLTLLSKEQGAWTFFATPGTMLSSIVWRIKPLSNVNSNQFLETNLCLTLNNEETCFTGVEDFAHCAYFTPCVTGYSRLSPNASGGYTASRYFPAGLAPSIGNGKISFRAQAPDIGAVLEMEIEVRVRDADVSLTR